MLNQQCQSTEGIQNEVYLFANAVLCKYTDHFRAVESIVMYGDWGGKFVTQGLLVTALKAGHWVLLDEINLASAETLECLSGLLESASGSVVLADRGWVLAIWSQKLMPAFVNCINIYLVIILLLLSQCHTDAGDAAVHFAIADDADAFQQDNSPSHLVRQMIAPSAWNFWIHSSGLMGWLWPFACYSYAEDEAEVSWA